MGNELSSPSESDEMVENAILICFRQLNLVGKRLTLSRGMI